MQINKEADFVLKSNKVVHPPVRTDGLELYYDTKGKKNTDTYKDKILDMSGNGRHGELHDFSYKNLSGYQEDSELVFDGIDDKLVLGDVEKPEIVSATKNLVNTREYSPFSTQREHEIISMDGRRVSQFKANFPITEMNIMNSFKEDTQYTLHFYVKSQEKNGITVFFNYTDGTTTRGIVLTHYDAWEKLTLSSEPDKTVEEITIQQGSNGNFCYVDLDTFQLEEGTTATPYVPYIPSIRGTYQLNNNIISYDRDTVRWVKDGEVMERKGINLIRNGNFWNGTTGWTTSSQKLYSNGGILHGEATITDYSSRLFTECDIASGNVYYAKIEGLKVKNEDINYLTLTTGNNPAALVENISSLKDYDEEREVVFTPKENAHGIRFNFGIDTINNEPIEYELKKFQLIDLTATFGAGNEPTLEEIQAEPDRWQWLPNPLDLVEAKELKGNILGDMEDIIDDHTRDEQSGIEVFTDKADDSLVKVEVDGKSLGGGSGKNLATVFRTSAYRTSTNVIIESDNLVALKSTYGNSINSMLKPKDNAFVRADSGQYTVSFEASDSSIPIRTIILVKDINGAIIKSGVTGHGVYNIAYEGFYRDDSDTARTFTLPQNTHSVAVGLQVTQTDAGEDPRENKVFNLQLEEGSTATAYEPPAPTPEYPIEIHSLNDFDVVSSIGKRNFIRNSDFKDGIANWWGSSGEVVNRDGYAYYEFIGNGSANMHGVGANSKVLLEPNTEYIYSVDMWAEEEMRITRSTPLHYHIRSISTGKGALEGGVSLVSDSRVEANKWSRVILQFSTNSTVDGYLQPYIYAFPNGVLGRVKNFKLEKSSTITPYTPSLEDITEETNHPLIDKINLLLSEPLRSVGDVKDRLFRDSDGLWKVQRNIGETVFNGDERIYMYAESHQPDTVGFYTSDFGGDRPVGGRINSLVSHFGYGEASDIAPGAALRVNYETYSLHAAYIKIAIYKDRLSSIDSLGVKDWLKKQFEIGTPVTWVYQIEPYTELLDQELQDKLNNLRSFQDSNYIYTIINETDGLPSHISENLKPMIHTDFLSKDHYKENRTVNNLLIWNRSLEDEELLNQNKLFHERFNMRSNTIKGEPITQTINLTQGGYAANTLSLEYTIEI